MAGRFAREQFLRFFLRLWGSDCHDGAQDLESLKKNHLKMFERALPLKPISRERTPKSSTSKTPILTLDFATKSNESIRARNNVFQAETFILKLSDGNLPPTRCSESAVPMAKSEWRYSRLITANRRFIIERLGSPHELAKNILIIFAANHKQCWLNFLWF